jgi:hypothetical protein
MRSQWPRAQTSATSPQRGAHVTFGSVALRSLRRGHPRALCAVAAALIGACGPGATSERAEAPAPSSKSPHEAVAPAPRPTVTPRQDAPAAPPPQGQTAPAPPCAEVAIGLDLRALPHSPSDDSIRLYVLGQIDDLRRSAPAGSVQDVRYQPGVGSMHALFMGATEAEALARCSEAVDGYLPTAPRLPRSMQPAARVLIPCRRCDAP